MHARVVDVEPGVVDHGHLLRHALDRRDAVDQRAAGARRLRGVEHGAAALRGEPLGVPRGVRQRADQRQHHQGESREEQSEEGPRIERQSGSNSAARVYRELRQNPMSHVHDRLMVR